MNTKFLKYCLGAALMFGFAACSDSWVADTDGRGEGRLEPRTIQATVVNQNLFIPDNHGVNKAPRRAAINTTNFLVTVYDNSGNVVRNWTIGTLPEIDVFPVGTYRVKVESHKVNEVDWDAPYFVGEQSFTITAGGITQVPPIECKLANIRVSIVFADDLKAKADGDDLKVTVTAAPGVELVFTPDEARHGYFAHTEGLSTLKVNFQGTISGVKENTTAILTNVAPGQHRRVTIGMKSNNNKPDDEVGNIEIDNSGVNVDFSVEESDLTGDIDEKEDTITPGKNPGKEEVPEEPVEPGPDDPVDPTEPEIAFTSDYLDLTGANNADEFGLDEGLKPAVVHIFSKNGFNNLVVDIESAFLTEEMLSSVNFTSHFDLANPTTEDLASALSSFGFPIREQITGEGVTDLDFNISPFVGLIFEAGDHKFHITVTDKNGASKTMTLLIRKF